MPGGQVLRAACWYAVLAPAGSEQATLLNLTAQDRRLDDLPLHKELLTSFLTKEARCVCSCVHAAVRTCPALRQFVYRIDAPVGCRFLSQCLRWVLQLQLLWRMQQGKREPKGCR